MSSALLDDLKAAGINARYPELRDRGPMIQAYSQALDLALKTKPHTVMGRMGPKDVEYVVDAILSFQEAYALVLEEQVLLGYRINDLWFRPEERTFEEFTVLRLYPGNFRMPRVIKVMEAAARHYGCTSINSGTVLAPDDERLARCYERAGFHRDAITLWKGMEN